MIGTLGIVQARASSTRLPKKVLADLCGRPMLAYELERLRRCTQLDHLVVATSTEESDDDVARLCESVNVPVTRGPLHDVLARFVLTLESNPAQRIVRLTGDCPLIDPVIVDRVVQRFLDNDVDYVSNGITSTFPRGLDCEVFSAEVLLKAAAQADQPDDREHVTSYIYRSGKFRLANVSCEPPSPACRLTVDTTEDLALIRRIAESFEALGRGSNYSMNEILELLEQRPAWQQLNANVEQKPLGG